MTEANFHGAGGGPPEADGHQVSNAERARTLVERQPVGSLSTMSAKHPGYPFGSVMPFGLDQSGQPVFLISSMAMHTKNLRGDPRATLLITEGTTDGNVLGAGRVSLMGDVNAVQENDRVELAERYLVRHPQSAQWMNYGDFAFYRLSVLDIYFVGGFGVMGWVTADDYRNADPDPLIHVAEGVVTHMNEDHADSLLRIAKNLGGVDATDARMTGIDRLGIDMAVTTEQGQQGLRVAFPESIQSADDVREVMVKLARSAS